MWEDGKTKWDHSLQYRLYRPMYRYINDKLWRITLIKRYFTIVRSGVDSLLTTRVHEKQAQKLYPKGPSNGRLQAEGVVGIDKACHFASSCHAYMICFVFGGIDCPPFLL